MWLGATENKIAWGKQYDKRHGCIDSLGRAGSRVLEPGAGINEVTAMDRISTGICRLGSGLLQR